MTKQATSTQQTSAEPQPNRRRWLKAGLGALAVCALPAQRSQARAGTARKGLIRTIRSPYFDALEDQAIRCTLCPRKCRLARGERGGCRVRENRNGNGVSLVYGNPAIVQIDPVERKPFYHVLPGSRSLSVATAGCNMSCKFCEVWDTALVAPEDVFAYDLPPDEVMNQIAGTDVRSVAYTFGEPIVFFEYMLAIAQRVHDAGHKNLLHTNGYIEPKPLRDLIPFLDGINIDLKGFDPETYRRISGGELEVVQRTLRTIRAAGIHLEVTYLVIPTLTDAAHEIKAMSQWIYNELGARTPLHLARFYPLYQLANLPPTPVSTLNGARDIARSEGLDYVYISKVPGHEGENTYCPGCGKSIIQRTGFILESIDLRDGKCRHCGHTVPGVWT